MDKKDSPTDTDTDAAADDGESRGLTDSFGLIAVSLLVIGVVGAGLTIAQTPMGADSGKSETVTADSVLDGVREKYNSSESIAGNATIEVSKQGETRSYAVSFAATDDNESRVSVEGENRSVVMGSNGSAVWLHSEKAGLTRVYSRDEIRDIKEGDAEPFEGYSFNHSREDEYPWGSVDANTSAPWKADGVHSYNHNHSHASNHSINTTAEYVGTQTVRGTQAHVVEVSVRHENRSQSPETFVTYWVSNDDVVLRQKTETPNATVTVDVTQTRFNVSIADSTFEPPTDGETSQFATSTFDSFDELQDSTEFELLQLDSYSFDEGRKIVYAGETAAVQEYVDDGSRFRVVSAEDTNRSSDFPMGRHTATGTDQTSRKETEVVIDGVNTTVTVSETSQGAVVSWTQETDEAELRHAVMSETESAETVLDVVKKVG